MPSSASCTRSASWPTTTMSGSTPAFDTRPTALRTSVSPSSSMNSLFLPMRVDVPAASTTPAIAPSRSGMDRLPFLAQMPGLLVREHRKQLGDDADGDLLGAVGANREPDRRKHASITFGAELTEDLVGARARTEQADVHDRAREKYLHPVAVVGERVHLHDRQRPGIDGQ